MSAALTTNTSASATCTTTSALRVLLRSRLALDPRAAPIMGVSTCRACLSAVIEPNMSVDASETATLNASTGGRRRSPEAAAGCSGRSRRGRCKSAVCEHQAERRYRGADQQALDEQLSRDSHGTAPSAARTANSGRRASARTSMRFAMLAHAIEQHRTDRAHEHPQRARDAADHVVLQRANDRGDSHARDVFARDVASERGATRRPDRQHALDVGTGLRRRNARLESRQRLIVVVAPGSLPAGSSRTATMMSGCGVMSRNLKSGGMMPTTCDGPRVRALDRDLPPERRFVTAESPLPERVRENDRRRPFGGGSVLRSVNHVRASAARRAPEVCRA